MDAGDPAAMMAAFARGPMPRAEVGAGTDRARVREVAEQFEGEFIGQMLTHMFAGIETDGPFGGGFGEEMFRSLMVQEYGRIMARRGGIGIADSVERVLLRTQEVAR